MISLAPTTRQALRRTAALTAVSVLGSLALFLLAMQIFHGVNSRVTIKAVAITLAIRLATRRLLRSQTFFAALRKNTD
jgi:transcriptional regulator of nitric oxide reductase